MTRLHSRISILDSEFMERVRFRKRTSRLKMIKPLLFHSVRIFPLISIWLQLWVNEHKKRNRSSAKFSLSPVKVFQKTKLIGSSKNTWTAAIISNSFTKCYKEPRIDNSINIRNLRQHVSTRSSSQTKVLKSARIRSS